LLLPLDFSDQNNRQSIHTTTWIIRFWLPEWELTTLKRIQIDIATYRHYWRLSI